MKLRRNTGAKIAITGAAIGMLLAFLGLVKADPRLHAQEQSLTRPTAPTPTRPDYRGFFVPRSREHDDDEEHDVRRLPQTSPQPQQSATVHTRTRAS